MEKYLDELSPVQKDKLLEFALLTLIEAEELAYDERGNQVYHRSSGDDVLEMADEQA